MACAPCGATDQLRLSVAPYSFLPLLCHTVPCYPGKRC